MLNKCKTFFLILAVHRAFHLHCSIFSALTTCYIFPTLNVYYVFPRMPRNQYFPRSPCLTCFPALTTWYMLSRA